jgi:hypothetical protein
MKDRWIQLLVVRVMIILATTIAPLAYGSDDSAAPSPAAFSIEPTVPANANVAPAPLSVSPTSDFDDALHIDAHAGLWAMSLGGEVGVRRFKTPVHESFNDLFKDFDIGGMGGVEVHKGDWVIETEAVYAKLSADENITGPLGRTRGIDFSSQLGIVAVSIGYTMVRTTLPNKMPVTLTPAIGVRWTYVDAEINPDDLSVAARAATGSTPTSPDAL